MENILDQYWDFNELEMKEINLGCKFRTIVFIVVGILLLGLLMTLLGC